MSNRIFMGAAIAMAVTFPVFAAGDEQKKEFGDWVASCKIDKMTDKNECSVYAHLNYTRKKPNGFYILSIKPNDSSVAIVGEPIIVGSKLRVDKQQMQACERQICVFSDDSSKNIINDLGSGTKVIVQIVSYRGNFEFELDAAGYKNALNQVTAWQQ